MKAGISFRISSIFFVIMFILFLFNTSAASALVNGVDVSHWQGTIEWNGVYNAGYRFAFAKATEGTSFIDSQFSNNMINAPTSNILIGAYHFARPDINADAKSEASHFVKTAKLYLKKEYLRPVLDLERGSSLGKTTLSNWVHTWMNTVKKETGIEPIIYVNSNYANNYLDSSINKYDLWIAHWTYDPSSSPNTGIWSSWDFWQFSNKGVVSGITGDVDLDLFNGDINQLQSYKISITEKSLIKSSDNPRVYWFQNKTLYWIKDEATFNLMQPIWQWGNIVTYDPTTFNQILNAYKTGFDFVSDGILIKTNGQPAVYLMENIQKRAFFNYEAFTNYGFKDEDIIIVTESLLNSESVGELIYSVGYQSGREVLFKDAFNRASGTNNLGYARTTAQPWGTGQIQYFKRLNDNSAIVYNPNENYAYPTYGAIYTKYTARGANIYGFPIGDEAFGIDSSITGARATFQRFRGGSNTDTSINHYQIGPNRGLTVETHTPILEKWAAIGYGASCAGLPVSDVYSWQNGLRADFENGYIYWDGTTTSASCETPTSTCSDGIKNGDEADIDCGGSCSVCPNGKSCSFTNTNCQSNYCNPNNICSIPSCTDGWRNGNELGIDCGGLCQACPTAECENPAGGEELTANQPSGIGQHYPTMAMDPLGNFVIAWHGSDGSGDGIFAQQFNADGSKAGNEFRVNTYTTNGQQYPDVAMDANGNFVITWESYGQDGSSLGIYAQRYNKNRIPQGPEFRVNTYTTDPQSRPAIAMDVNGNFAITWESQGQDGSGSGVFAQRFDSQGNPQGLEAPINQYTTDYQRNPDVAMDANGNYVITWSSTPGQNGWASIYAQRYDKNGNALGNGNFEVNTHHGDAGSKSTPAIAMDPLGNFVITWASTGQNWDVFARRFDKFGNALTNEIPINTYTFSDQFQPAIAMDSQGNFVITWRGYGGPVDGFDIFARRFDVNGNPLSGEFDVNTYAPKDEDAPVVAMTSKTNFVIAWYSWREDNQYDVIYRMYKCAPLCSNGAKDPAETDTDCGGSCLACSDGKICLINNDCINNYCNQNKICSIPSCTDGWKNKDETDTDCGGSCGDCQNGKSCLINQDCQSNYCNPLTLNCETLPISCFDGIKNQDEKDIDCGGSCQDCVNEKSCLINQDCQSNYCNPNKICSSISCFDGWKNGDERGIDCGGSCDKKCEVKFRILAMPIKDWNSQQEFENTAKERIDFFINDIPLKDCSEKIEIVYGDISKNYSTFSCSKNDPGLAGLNLFTHRLGFNLTKYDAIAGFVKQANCENFLGFSDGVSTIWAQTGGNFPEIFAHEMGHLYNLEDEYCSNQAGSRDERCNDGGKPADYDGDKITPLADINFLSKEYSCDPTTDGNCCGEKAGFQSCTLINYGACCYGNEANVQHGRSIMSYAGAPGPRSFEKIARDHLATYPKLRCESAGGGGGINEETVDKIISVNLRVYKDNTVKEDYILLEEGIPSDYHQEGDYRISIMDSSGQSLWNKQIYISFGWTGPVLKDIDYSEVSFSYKDLNIKVPYNQDMREIRLYYKDILIFSKILEFCDLDGICDTTESHNTCASDCPLDKPDVICNPESDGICDPDCFTTIDLDCIDKDSDSDNIPDTGDNCVDIKNPNQEDNDLDRIGDSCDEDIDNDNILNNNDNCIYIANPDQLDTDKNSVGDACNDFEDQDNDKFADILDNCPAISNPNQEDKDNDKIGDACDPQTCSNNILEIGEECDNSALGDKVCKDFGFDAGALLCSTTCTFDIAQCYDNKFLRGDSNTDGVVDISDPIKTLFYLYSDSQILCKETADTNDDGKIDISDSIFTLDFLFKAGPTIKSPYPNIGIDTTPENPDLGCESYNPPAQAGGGGGLTPEDILNDPNTDQQIKDIIKPYACLLNGDVNQDKKTDMNDYYSLSYALSGRFKINELCKCNADVNEDKLINQNDASILYNSIRYNKPLVKEGECEKVSISSPTASPSPSPSPSPTQFIPASY